MVRIPRLEPLYRVFDDFLQRCLVEDRSLLWPEREVWTITVLEEARRRFVEGFIQGQGTFRAKLEAQLGGAPGEVWALIADCFYIYGLPSRSMREMTKRGWVRWAAERAGLSLPPEDDPLWLPLSLGFSSTGQKYNFKHAQLRLLIMLALEIKAQPVEERAALVRDPSAMQALLDGILESIPLKLDRANDMRSAILHMAFPEAYEAVISSREKDAILAYYQAQAGGSLPADRDEALRVVRRALEPRLGAGFDFYGEARAEWRSTSSTLERALAGPGSGGIVSGVREVREHASQWASTSDPDVLRVLSALKLSRNVILSGPPGTGKTYIAHKVARGLVEGQGEPQETYLSWVTLHPSYSYEDFVEGLRPVLARAGSKEDNGPVDSGRITYEVRPGVFREVSERAARDPGHTYVLVLDEINRANLAKILGELVTLIEDDKRGVLAARLPYSGARFSVPPNLVLLGTMNTADRSIALLDSALRRRFAFIDIQPRPELLAGAVVETDEAALHLDALLRCLNSGISEALGADHRLGHSYFLRAARAAEEERLPALEQVWNAQVLPLLEEYFYARRDRLAEILAPFVEDGEPPSGEIQRLTGEDLIVALSRVCEGKGDR